MNDSWIAPSILSADFARLGEEASKVLSAGADLIHFDVMDNHYVPNLTIGPMVCQSLRNYGIKAPIDVHLMVKPVDRIIVDFAKAGASYISFHPEASDHIHRSIQIIKDSGCKSGLALNPGSPVSLIEPVIDSLDLILVMSVNPGFGGQTFIESSLEKIQSLKKIIDKSGKNIRLEVDGGIKTDNIGKIAQAGANTFVAGSAIFSNDDYKSTIDLMRKEISNIS
ncbi:MAG: ribulose-phosphate 3-epimerase [Gammaproteobacteria bacterium]|nr:ribulose-phosphate 3-epimerase [Gammaproteobacteria bacterium]|tara:strand:- start:3331 stop:4002 length:672 start_codon:yes stop_codon:yes gene_type:complete